MATGMFGEKIYGEGKSKGRRRPVGRKWGGAGWPRLEDTLAVGAVY